MPRRTSNILGTVMMDLERLGERVAEARRERKLTQTELARRAGIGRSTLAALEGGKLSELGFNRVAMLLATLGLDLVIATANQGRPTFDELKEEAGRHA